MNFFSFCLSEKALIFFLLLNNFTKHRILGRFFSFSSLNILLYFLWPPKFLMRNLLIILLRIPCMWHVASLLLLSGLSQGEKVAVENTCLSCNSSQSQTGHTTKLENIYQELSTEVQLRRFILRKESKYLETGKKGKGMGGVDLGSRSGRPRVQRELLATGESVL